MLSGTKETERLVIDILTQAELMDKTANNLMEVKSRGGYIVALTSDDSASVQRTTGFTIADCS